jgi:hypothetical protein
MARTKSSDWDFVDLASASGSEALGPGIDSDPTAKLMGIMSDLQNLDARLINYSHQKSDQKEVVAPAPAAEDTGRTTHHGPAAEDAGPAAQGAGPAADDAERLPEAGEFVDLVSHLVATD